jgi:hypothetical protein
VLLVQCSVDLRSWTPDRGALFPIQNLELDSGFIDDSPRDAVERIDFSQDCTLPNASKGRVARTYAQVIEFRRDKGGSGAGSGSCSAGFGTSMTAAYYNDIKGPMTTVSVDVVALVACGSRT